MKRTIDWYLDEALSRSGATSDRRLSELLGKGPNAVNFYRTKKALPTDDTMMDIARLAGVDQYIALLDLNFWRTNGTTQAAYKKILEKITAAIFVISTLAGAISPTLAADAVSNPKSVSVYYGK